MLQIPAFLVRQTDLLIAAAVTGKAVTLKKGQFLSPESMKFAVDKVKDSGNDKIALIEEETLLVILIWLWISVEFLPCASMHLRY